MNSLTEKFWNAIERHYGIRANEHKNSSILELASKRARELNVPTLEEYIERFVLSALTDEEYRFWATQLTVNETYFFRDEQQWDAVREKALPELIRLKAPAKTLRTLSLGASSGEEPYTLAMIIDYYFRGLPGWKVTIDATDIKEEILERARAGDYTERSVRGVPREIADRYLSGKLNRYSLAPEIRSRVNFFYHNILDLPAGLPAPQYDLIICRNVIIYFSKEVAIDVLRRMLSLLHPEGYLMLGHSEGHLTNSLDVMPIFTNESILYQRSQFEKRESTTDFGTWIGLRKQLTHAGDDLIQAHREDSLVMTDIHPADERQHLSIAFPDALVDEAENYIERQEFDRAKMLLTEAIRQLPLYTPAHYLLGILYQVLDEHDKALRQFERVIYLDPKHILASFQCAMMHQQKGNVRAAAKLYRSILSLTDQFDTDYVIDRRTELTIGFVQMMCSNFIHQQAA